MSAVQGISEGYYYHGKYQPAFISVVESCSVKDLAMQRFLDLWTSQLSKLRANSIHLLDVLAVRHLGFRVHPN